MLSLIIVTFFFVHVQVRLDSYKDFQFDILGIKQAEGGQLKISTAGNSTFYSVDKYSKFKGKIFNDEDVFTLDKIKVSSLYFLYFRTIAILILVFLCFKRFQNVIESLKSIESFKKSNVLYLKRLAFYLFLIFIVNLYVYIGFEEGSLTSISISVTPLLLALLSIILAEVFKEGNQLMEENKLTV